MDLNDIKNSVSNLTLYDLKAGFRKAQNGTFLLREPCLAFLTIIIAVMNYTEMEAKVCSPQSTTLTYRH